VLAKRLAEKSISNMAFLVLSGTLILHWELKSVIQQ